MADQKSKHGIPIPAKLVEAILMGHGDTLQLQDSPILGDVWLAYAARPADIHDLLITPSRGSRAGAVARSILTRIDDFRETKRFEPLRKIANTERGASVAYLEGIVAAQLYFDEVLSVLVPMTLWWHEKDVDNQLESDKFHVGITDWMLDLYQSAAEATGASERMDLRYDFTALDRYVALAGLILWSSRQKSPDDGSPTAAEICARASDEIGSILEGLAGILKEIGSPSVDGETGVGQVSLNRRAAPALDKSIPAVKADAARGLFEVSCEGITWAVLDSGIQSDHPAFRGKDGKSRVKKSLDFTRVRDIISSDTIAEARRKELMHGIKLSASEAKERLKTLETNARNDRPLDWDLVQDLITLDEATANEPSGPHGTHVAGIIGASADEEAEEQGYASGMCPNIKLYDLRVLDRTVEETEFAVIAALQFIRFLNDRYTHMSIQGANLSLSIPHNVRNYACGNTPVCKWCETLVNSGVVVVAAAGNRGFQRFETEQGTFENYAAFSITDPGNADGVITVGSTHRYWPHTYGVSFFSSRGPTGDGRPKPDLVAPGERIQAPIPTDEWGPQSGTSMAAPHVSGAAAMLLARHSELVGQPRRIKEILCQTATNLGRENSFQGHGMLDVLRAMQSI